MWKGRLREWLNDVIYTDLFQRGSAFLTAAALSFIGLHPPIAGTPFIFLESRDY